MGDNRGDLVREGETHPDEDAHEGGVVWFEEDDMPAGDAQHFTHGAVRRTAMVKDFVSKHQVV